MKPLAQSVTEVQRREIVAAFCDPLWASAPDHEIADAVGVRAADVRRLRGEHRRDLGIGALSVRLRCLAESIGWPGTLGELLASTVDAAADRAEARGHRHTDARSQRLREALADARRGDALERAADGAQGQTATGCGHSVDRVRSRGRARAEASEGASRDRDSRSPVSRGTGWGRGRVGHGPGAAAVRREG